jgi:hypothetical protein
VQQGEDDGVNRDRGVVLLRRTITLRSLPAGEQIKAAMPQDAIEPGIEPDNLKWLLDEMGQNG